MTRATLLFSSLAVAIGTAVAAATVWFMVSRNASLTVRSLSLVDSQNRVVAMLRAPAGAPELALLDRQGRKRAAFFLEENGTPDLYLYDADRKARAGFDLYDSGVPNLSSTAPGNDPSYTIYESPSGHEIRFSIGRVDGGKAHTTGTFEFSVEGGQPRVRMLDGQNRVVWQIPVPAASHNDGFQPPDLGTPAGKVSRVTRGGLR